MPVHLKGGSGDTLLYRLTIGLAVLGELKYYHIIRLFYN